jgi:hypothetical protein
MRNRKEMNSDDNKMEEKTNETREKRRKMKK